MAARNGLRVRWSSGYADRYLLSHNPNRWLLEKNSVGQESRFLVRLLPFVIREMAAREIICAEI
jgi:hypothetical protein